MQLKQDVGKNIIFLVSQPRAGSTLTQKILGTHSKIHTTSEPWLMLHPLYAFRETGYKADYNEELARAAVCEFFSSLPDECDSYFNAVAQVYSRLYEQAMSPSGKSYFLDKTPRYYNIIPELYKTFPEAHFIILLRNPLAILSSIINTWVGDKWLGLRNFKHDLVAAPSLLIDGIDTLGIKATLLHYEEILNDPSETFKSLCMKLDIDFEPDMLNYGDKQTQKWLMGDQDNLYQHNRVNTKKINGWIESLESPQIWRLQSDYLDLLGADLLKAMGYDYSECKTYLDKYYPGRLQLWKTIPLNWLIQEPHEFGTWNYGYYPIRLMNALQRKGLLGTGVELTRKTRQALFSLINLDSYEDKL